MRKYYCPYCGKKCMKLFEKRTRRYHILVNTDIHCPECLKTLGIINNSRFSCALVLFLFLVLPVFLLYIKIPEVWDIIVGLLAGLLIWFNIMFFSKFIKQEGDQLDEYFDIGTIEFAKDFKFPKYHFMTESVSVLEVDGEQIPIRIEPIEIGIKSGKFKFNCIADNSRLKIDTEGKKLKVLDGERVIGYMTVEKYIPIN